MSDVPSPQLRISDQDRESALRALGEHVSVGRIDIDEYGDRSVRITSAKTRGELAEVFEDLPKPHPVFDRPAPAMSPVPTSSTTAEPAVATAYGSSSVQWSDRPLPQRLAAALVPFMWVVGLALFFTVGGWLWFLLPVAVTAIGRAVWGQDWHDEQRDHRGHGRDLRQDRRDRRRELGG
ncbi:DUF1707 SHOCT-like domain-containing protein [Amycolatopsis sp. H20-H5]|uniref:DUF1707 SHOCT-like domain-containing protein n=1 Tax=Amycolatopsis sp. H20-H5 TaxID=3046309 RepID=UPI002DBB84D1|nr:DUF1707 domain-containing protein [Amycolatopsis sp. H20-H5]MEC3978129.1 DUF1707 domain-containing protein [Amycolatopsis sp. H20-H5]